VRARGYEHDNEGQGSHGRASLTTGVQATGRQNKLQTKTILCDLCVSVVKTSDLFRELRPTLTLAFPIIVGHMSQMLIGLTDSAFIGRVGTVPLAAAAFTNGVFGIFYVVGIGLLLGAGV